MSKQHCHREKNKKNNAQKNNAQKNLRIRSILTAQLRHGVAPEKPLITRQSGILAAVMGVVMAALALYSWQTADEGQEWLWLAVVFMAAAFVVNLFRIRYSALVEMLLAAFAPAAVFMLVESYTHLLSQMWEGPIFLNLVIYYLFFGFLLFVTGRTGAAIIIGSLLLGFAGLANYFVLMFRSSPILPWDLYSVGVAATVADNFEYNLSVRACHVLLLILLLWALCLKMRLKLRISRLRWIGMIVFLVLMLGYGKGVQTDEAIAYFNMDTTLFTPTVLYRNNGLVLSFIVNMRYLNVEKPADYSEEELARIQEEVSAGETAQSEDGSSADGSVSADEAASPNVIVIMNEAFSDLSVLGDFETNQEVMPFINSLSEDTQKGWLYVSVKGGNTANTEFEFLTGLSMYNLPVGSIPYQQYIRSELPSLASQLSSIGYTSVAIHPYYGSGWNRDQVYEDLGFDEKYFIDSFTAPEKLRTYVSDWSTYEKIIERYENKAEDEKLFVFDVTMQNHGSYVKRYDNFVPDVSIVNGSGTYLAATEQYLSLIKRSDEALRQLVTYFQEQSEPTIIVMFGDHQPADYITNVVDDGKVMDEDVTSMAGSESTSRADRYIVPYVLWANYDIEECTDDETSPNYLALRVLEAAGLPMTDYQQFLLELEKAVPVLSASAMKILDLDEANTRLMDDYLLKYNTLFDAENRLENFFTYKLMP